NAPRLPKAPAERWRSRKTSLCSTGFENLSPRPRDANDFESVSKSSTPSPIWKPSTEGTPLPQHDLSAIRTVCRSRRLLAWASVMVMWACGGGRVTATGSDASASAAGDERAGETADAAGPGSGDGQSGSSTDGGLAMAPICPDTEPTEGAPCLPTL